MKKFVVGLVVGALVSAPVAALASNKDNDVVLNQKQYTEYFKNEGHTKNYLYTRTEIPAPAPGKCVVITGASERTMTMACNINPS